MRRDGGMVVGTREEQHVGRHARDALVLLHGGFEHRAILLGAAWTRQRDLRLAEEVADRRAQVVGEFRRERGQAVDRALQAIQHVVERHRGLHELGRGVFHHQALLQGQRIDAGRRRAEAPRARQDAAGHPHAHEGRQHRPGRQDDLEVGPGTRAQPARGRGLDGQGDRQRLRGEMDASQQQAVVPAIRRLPQPALERGRAAQAVQLARVGVMGQAVDRHRLRGKRLQRRDVAARLRDQCSPLVIGRRVQPARATAGAADDARHRGRVAARGEDVVADEGEVRQQQELVVLAQLLLDVAVEHDAEDEDDEDGEQGDREADLRRHRAPRHVERAAQGCRRRGHGACASNT